MEEKQARLNQLKRIVYKSDEEILEMEKLQEELKFQSNEQVSHFSGTKISLGEGKGSLIPIQAKPSLLRKLLRVKQKEPSKPVTQEDLDQLKLDAQKEELLARIAKAKSQRKNNTPSIFESIQKVIGKSTNNPFDISDKSSKKRPDYDPFGW